MGTSFWISPVNAEAKARLRQVKASVPRRLPKGRVPTAADLRHAANTMVSGYLVNFRPELPVADRNWCIIITSKGRSKKRMRAWINVKFKGIDAPLELIVLEGGSPEVAAALAIELAKFVGPLLLDGEDSYGPHIVVGATVLRDLVTAMKTWSTKKSRGLKALEKVMALEEAMDRETARAYRKKMRGDIMRGDDPRLARYDKE